MIESCPVLRWQEQSVEKKWIVLQVLRENLLVSLWTLMPGLQWYHGARQSATSCCQWLPSQTISPPWEEETSGASEPRHHYSPWWTFQLSHILLFLHRNESKRENNVFCQEMQCLCELRYSLASTEPLQMNLLPPTGFFPHRSYVTQPYTRAPPVQSSSNGYVMSCWMWSRDEERDTSSADPRFLAGPPRRWHDKVASERHRSSAGWIQLRATDFF